MSSIEESFTTARPLCLLPRKEEPWGWAQMRMVQRRASIAMTPMEMRGTAQMEGGSETDRKNADQHGSETAEDHHPLAHRPQTMPTTAPCREVEVRHEVVQAAALAVVMLILTSRRTEAETTEVDGVTIGLLCGMIDPLEMIDPRETTGPLEMIEGIGMNDDMTGIAPQGVAVDPHEWKDPETGKGTTAMYTEDRNLGIHMNKWYGRGVQNNFTNTRQGTKGDQTDGVQGSKEKKG